MGLSPGRLGLSGSIRFRSALPGRGRSEAERVRAANSNAPARPSPTEQSRAEQKLMPITDEQNAILFDSMLWLRGRLEHHFPSILWLRSKLERHFSSMLRLRGKLEQHSSLSNTFRAFCGSGASSSGHFEPAAAPGQARAAISSHLRARGRF